MHTLVRYLLDHSTSCWLYLPTFTYFDLCPVLYLSSFVLQLEVLHSFSLPSFIIYFMAEPFSHSIRTPPKLPYICMTAFLNVIRFGSQIASIVLGQLEMLPNRTTRVCSGSEASSIVEEIP